MLGHRHRQELGGATVKGGKDKMGLAIILGLGKKPKGGDRPELDDDTADDGSGYKEGKRAAAEEVMQAFKSGDVEALEEALEAFVTLCRDEAGEE